MFRAKHRDGTASAIYHERGVLAAQHVQDDGCEHAEENRVEIVAGNGRTVRLAGKGAGRWPTALSILGDVHEYLRDRRLAQQG